ncbi:MAG: recombinase family protein [Candidatus Pelagibacter sp.]|nr:recombinase family protein [Candidatus Pelagibacter sp.]
MEKHKDNKDMVIGYCRISTHKQSKGSSLDYQEQKVYDYCKLNDLSLVQVYQEIDSGGNDDRLVLSTIKQMIQDKVIKTLIVWKIDRLGRTMLGSLQFIELCKSNGVNVISISDNINTSNEQSQLMLNILLSIATEERRQIKQRCSFGRDMKWNDNRLPYPSIPYGYKRKNNNIVIDKSIQPIIEYIFRKFNLFNKMKNITKTKRTQRLLKLLNRKGYTFNGNDFKWWNLRDIISNPLYCGMVRWKGELKSYSPYEPMVSKRLFNQVNQG